MKSLIEKLRTGLLLVPAVAFGLSCSMPVVVSAAPDTDVTCTTDILNATSGANCAKGDQTPTNLFDGDNSIFKNIVNILLFLVGAVSVIMLIFGGIKYVTSGGAQDQVTSAKNTIMYAIIGIIVALLAFAVVNFVVGGLSTTT